MRRITSLFAVTAALLTAVSFSAAFAGSSPKAVVTPKADLKWTESGIQGVSFAAVDGDMTKGPCRFYLKYAAGFVAPLHHHSPDHYVTTVSGNLVLTVDGKDNHLAPGSFFALTGMKPHAAHVEGNEDCVMFVQAMGPWDVVPEKAPATAK